MDEIEKQGDLSKLVNPALFDENGEFRKYKYGSLIKKHGYVYELNYASFNCRLYNFFAIEGGKMPKEFRKYRERPNENQRFDNENIIRHFVEMYQVQ